MSILISVHQLKKSYAARPLFEGLTFSIESGERVGLIGPNGAGKSTLMRILAGQVAADEGSLSVSRGLRIGFLEQVPQFQKDTTVLESVLEGAKEKGTAGPDSNDSHDSEDIMRAHELLSRLSLNDKAEEPVAQLSGGWKKRVALARELLRRPDLLLLDEPTNHLDVESIQWLEQFLARASFGTLTITHDRLFLQRISNRILELDRRNSGGILSVRGDYATYLELKQSRMAAQEQAETRLSNTLRRETEWLRRGAKARTTKQQARIQRAGELKDTVEELSARNRQSSVRLDFQGADKNPKKLLEAKGIAKLYGGKLVVPPVDLVLTPGSRVGLLGPNGCGKSTLIRILLGDETADQGTVFRSEHLKTSWFEQNRESLDPDLTVLKTVCPVGDFVDYRGTRVHVKGYMDRFMFSYGQLEMSVGKLSGGEQSRLLIARLMLREANLLVLDEPTNDLDLATLDVLERVLVEFPGAVILVTHDRYFLDQVATKIMAFSQGSAGVPEIVNFANLSQWEEWQAKQLIDARENTAARAAQNSIASAGKKRKLSYKDQREYDTIEEVLKQAESRLEELQSESARPESVSNATRLNELTKELAAAQAEVERLYARWAELEN